MIDLLRRTAVDADVSDALSGSRRSSARRARATHPADGSHLGPREYEALLAFAEATIPGGGRVQRADEQTIAMVEETVAHLFPQLPKALGAVALAYDHAAIAKKGRRFRDLSADDQEDVMRAWESDPVLRAPFQVMQFAIKFAHFDREPVYERMGGKLNVVKTLEQPRWLEQVVRAETWEDGDVECEVVVVGTGAGGAVVGRELAERGFAVCFVEEGELHRRDAFTGSSQKAHRDFYRGGMAVGTNLMPVFMGRLVGGSTAVNGGTCFRTPASVLDRWCEDIGTDEFARERMSGYFERVEGILQTQPASRQHIGRIADVFARGCDKLGWSHFSIVRNAPGCEGSGFCDFGCRTDARRSTNISYVPPALERGAMLFTGLSAKRVIVENGRAVGIEGEAKNGKTIRVRGRAVVFAGGALPTPLFLLKNGLCNSSGQVGRNLTLHPSGGLNALFDDEIRGMNHIPQGYGCDEHLDDGILLSAAQPDWNYAALMYPVGGRRLMERLNELEHIASFGILIADESRGRIAFDVQGSATVLYNLTQKDADRYHRGVMAMGDICWEAGAKKVWPALLGAHTFESRREWERFRKQSLAPSQCLLTSYHPLGTCKMGKDPRTSVVSLDHEAHDLPGFFIVDGSTVPGPLGVNPQLTIMAMATRAAERIAARL
ncbi:Oxidoreductase, GMC family [Sandaracinus amylolyticus]|uniref:Oxidoreductase, GMC family n=1 Tax=Sandaracinus amylolyticus TaxID=927083 RepID=A0A0F6YHE4_9BACT|nr:Oxidoreductase, GMC family [Sandaracinus amylolyticus]